MSRGKEYKGQTLVIDGSKSGSSIVVTRLAYDSAFNLEFIGEARYGSAETDQYWYIERLSYDSAFNLVNIETAQNQRALGPAGSAISISGSVVTVPADLFISDLNPGDLLDNIPIVSINGVEITLSGTLGTTVANDVVVTLENYIVKDFNKRAWTIRNLYVYR